MPLTLPDRRHINVNTEVELNLTTPLQLFGNNLVSFYSPTNVTMHSVTPYISSINNLGSDGASGNLSTTATNRPLYVESDKAFNNQPSFEFGYNSDIATAPARPPYYSSSKSTVVTGLYNSSYNTVAGSSYTYFGCAIGKVNQYGFILDATQSSVINTYRQGVYFDNNLNLWSVVVDSTNNNNSWVGGPNCQRVNGFFFMVRMGTTDSTNYMYCFNSFINNKASNSYGNKDLSPYYRKGLIIGLDDTRSLTSVVRIGEVGIVKDWVYSDTEFYTLRRYFQIKFGV